MKIAAAAALMGLTMFSAAAMAQSHREDVVKGRQPASRRVRISARRHDRGMQVAIPCVPERPDEHVMPRGYLLDLGHRRGKRCARDRHVVEEPITLGFQRGNRHASRAEEHLGLLRVL